MNKRIPIAITVLSLILIGGYFIDRARAAHQSLLSGYWESQPTQASSRLGGRVTRIFVKEGDHVKAGQPLVELETKSYQATFEAQAHQAEQARQQYAETARGPRTEDIQKQRAALNEAQAAYHKLLNGPQPEEIRQARDKYKQAQAQYEKLRRGSRPEEIAQAQAAANVAEQKLKAVERGLTQEERAQLRARLEGAKADEALAKKQYERATFLFTQDAIPKQQVDTTLATYQQAQAKTKDAQEAYDRAERGTPKEELNQAIEANKQAQAQLALVKNGSRREDIEAAQQEMLAAEEALRLLTKGSRKEDIDAAKARLDQQQAALTELERGNRPEDVAKAKAAQNQAEAQQKSVAETLKEGTVYATTDCIVDRILVADGDLVVAGAPTVQLSDPNDIWLRVYLPEESLSKVKVGDDADLQVDGVSDEVKGKVESIATSGEFTPANLQSPEERGKQVFAIRIRLATPDPRVKAGMATTVKKVGQWP